MHVAVTRSSLKSVLIFSRDNNWGALVREFLECFKEWCIGPGRKRSSQKPSSRLVLRENNLVGVEKDAAVPTLQTKKDHQRPSMIPTQRAGAIQPNFSQPKGYNPEGQDRRKARPCTPPKGAVNNIDGHLAKGK